MQLVVRGQIDEAFQKHVDLSGKHHNTMVSAGFPALKKAMVENHAQFPNKQLEVKNVLEENDLVAVHSSLLIQHGQPRVVVVHLFRFRGDKIVEMWDVGQTVPVDSPNKDGPF